MGRNSDKKRKRRQKEQRRLRQEEERRRSLSQGPAERTSGSPEPSPPEARRAAPPHQPTSSRVEALLSRKRQLTSVTFVYPVDKDVQPRVYTFGSFGLQQSEPVPDTEDGSVGPLPLDQRISPAPIKDESIDEILYGVSKRQRVKLDDAPAREGESEPVIQETTLPVDDDNEHEQTLTPAALFGHLSGQTVADVVRDQQGLRPRANSTDGELMLPQRGLCDERQVLEAHRWNVDKHQLATRTPKGLMNLGNSCYLNSTLQCLAFLPPFCQTLLSLPDETSHNHSDPGGQINGNRRKMSLGKKITLMLRALFRRMHDESGGGHGSAIPPRSFVQAVPMLSSIGSTGQSNGKYKFRPGRQEDAHEFLVHLLDAMNDGELQEAGINQHVSGWRDRLPVPRLDETTLLRRIFGGYFRNEVRCTQCDKKSRTYDPFLDLSLEISRKNCNSLADAIREFTRKETLDSENRWKCPGCKKRVCATKQLTVFRPPLALCIQLKRFAFSGSMSFGGSSFHYKSHLGGGRKITKPIEFPSQLDLPLSDGRSCGYALTGLVIHVGGSASSGHYTAYVKRPSANVSSKWFHMDDSFVQAVSEHTVLRQRDAYVLFYCRREVRLEFPSPPLRSSMSAEEATQLGRARARARAESIDNAQQQRKPDVAPPHDAMEDKGNAPDNSSPMISLQSKPASVETATTQITQKMKLEQNESTSSLAGAAADDSASRSEGDSKSTDSDTDRSSSSHTSVADIRDNHPKEPFNELPNEPFNESPNEPGQIATKHVPLPNHTASVPTENGVKQNQTEPSTTSTDATTSKNKTRIVVGRGVSRESIRVMLGPRHKRVWKPKTTGFTGKDEDFSLLGNQRVSNWSDETASDVDHSRQDRKELVAAMDRTANKRKREHYLDRWDSAMDAGKQKKVKARKEPAVQTEPKNNRFQKIQADVLNMVSGRKGSHKNKAPSKSFKSNK